MFMEDLIPFSFSFFLQELGIRTRTFLKTKTFPEHQYELFFFHLSQIL